MIRAAVAALALLLAAACTPVVMPAGPPVALPRLAEDAVIAADGARLPMRSWAPEGAPRAVVLALHGFNDHSGNFLTDSLEALKQAGLLVYAYDQRGFGRAPNRGYWAGAETMAQDAATAARLLAARHPGLPLFLMGESMGAAVTILAAGMDPPPPVRAYVLLAPALWNRAQMNALLRGGIWLAERTLPALPVPADRRVRHGTAAPVPSDQPAIPPPPQALPRRRRSAPRLARGSTPPSAKGVRRAAHHTAAAPRPNPPPRQTHGAHG